ncbi:MAG: sigma-70 family RNA polymerase sigma factor [Alphaproteobacteria bacterium]|nr:sigma-70 family RNA polymerase sigma factor [Alphaproteobacteria bacterium]
MEQLISENKNFIRGIIRKLTGFYNEDIEQEIYIKAWKNLNSYHEEGKIKHWIACIASSVCKDYFRSRQYHQNVSETRDEETLASLSVKQTPEKTLDTKQRQKIILGAIDALPSQYRNIIIWYEFEELSYEQISQKTKLPLGTIKSRLYNARKLLAEKLKFLKGETYE